MTFLTNLIVLAPPLLVAVILHEIAHGLAAEKLGDPTARRLGRITLNPVPHIDPFMTIGLPLLLLLMNSPVLFGGAKPVPVDPRFFKNPRRGMAYVAIAGPVTNFILAGICYLLFQILTVLFDSIPLPTILLSLLLLWCIYGIIINLVLGLFNLLPVPPLDGGRIAVGFLPKDLAIYWARLEPFGILIIFGLLYSGVLNFLFTPILRLAEKILLT